ncbi:MAG: hypothetical protein ACXU71_04055 [Croceibacterium sp.]
MAKPSQKRAVRKVPPRAPRKRAPAPQPAEQSMEIHKPKPIHNWRELASEIGVIVVGILIALGLEQAMESWHQHQRFEETTRAINAELRQGLASAQIMADMQACQRQQLAALSDAVGKGDRTRAERLLGESKIFQGLSAPYSSWTAAVASDATNHFDQRQRTYYFSLFYVLEKESNWLSEYYRSQSRLTSLLESGLAQSPAASTDAVAELAEMSSILENMQGAFGVYSEMATGLGMKVTQADLDALPVGRDSVARCQAAAAAMNGPASAKKG